MNMQASEHTFMASTNKLRLALIQLSRMCGSSRNMMIMLLEDYGLPTNGIPIIAGNLVSSLQKCIYAYTCVKYPLILMWCRHTAGVSQRDKARFKRLMIRNGALRTHNVSVRASMSMGHI